MITVIATGFDGGRKRDSVRHAAAAQPAETGQSVRAPRERDFLDELERQRAQSADGGFQIETGDDHGVAAAATPPPPRVERSVGEPVPVKRAAAYDADDLEIPSFLRRK